MAFEYKLKGRVEMIDNLMIALEMAGARAWQFRPIKQITDAVGLDLMLYGVYEHKADTPFASLALPLANHEHLAEMFRRLFFMAPALAAGASLTLKYFEVLDALSRGISNGIPDPDVIAEANALLGQTRGAFIRGA